MNMMKPRQSCVRRFSLLLAFAVAFEASRFARRFPEWAVFHH
jgi:hypothetical protein